MRPPWWIVVVVLLIALGIGGGLVLLTGHGRSAGAATAPGSTPTSTDRIHFRLPKLVGTGLVSHDDFLGRPLVVNFFASWCTACRDEAPGFLKVDSEFHGAVTFVGVDSLETGDGVGFARELGYSRWPLARDVDGSLDSGLHDALGGVGMPITAFYGRDGTLVDIEQGALSEDALRNLIRGLYQL